jgi:hypothetical protein
VTPPTQKWQNLGSEHSQTTLNKFREQNDPVADRQKEIEGLMFSLFLNKKKTHKSAVSTQSDAIHQLQLFAELRARIIFFSKN